MDNKRLRRLLQSADLSSELPGSILDYKQEHTPPPPPPPPTCVFLYLVTKEIVLSQAKSSCSSATHSPRFAAPNVPSSLIGNGYFTGEKNTILWSETYDRKTQQTHPVLLVGLGEQKSVTHSCVLESFSTAIDSLLKTKDAVVMFYLDVVSNLFLDSITELVHKIGVCLSQSNHSFDFYLTEKKPTLREFHIAIGPGLTNVATASLKAAFAKGKCLGLCTIIARELANSRADDLNPEVFADLAQMMVSSEPDVGRIVLLREQDMIDLGLNLFHAVGQGSRYDSCLVAIVYEGEAAPGAGSTILLGKGITYDTGGLNLKPTGSIENMHLDKGGASAVLATMKAVLQLRPRKNVIGVLALAENAIGPLAYKPFSILKSFCGKTVRVANTDAEGRLVLADSLSFVQKEFQPKEIIDLATLTGSCAAALGEHYAGVFGNNLKLIQDLVHAGEESLERVWHMPLTKEHVAELKCSDADLNSMGGKYAGASTAAAFLSQFVSDTIPWAHIDIAGPAMTSKKRYWVPEAGTGFGVQLLARYLEI